jgi:long-chain fatty acid transport protein
MRKSILAGAVMLSSLSAAFATNGDNLIGLTPASRAMGGIGVGAPVGASDSIFRNPAWMTSYQGFNVSFGGILFMPNVKARNKVDFTPMGASFKYDTGYVKSAADTFVVPEIGIVYRVNDRVAFGVGAFGVSGMGVDYRNKDQMLSQMHTTFQFMRMIPALAVKVNDMISLSGALHIAWGSLDLGAVMCQNPMDPNTCWNAGGGQSQDLGLGFQLGASINIGGMAYAGITYQSPVSMTYKRVFDSNADGVLEDMKLQQPQEFAFGFGMAPSESFKFGVDLRWINWAGADGYENFGWKNQWVVGVGAEFKPTPKLALRAGWNYGKTPIRSKNIMDPSAGANNIPNFAVPFPDYNVEWFNLVGFPAISEHHLTLGLGYEVSKNFSIELSYVRAFEKKVETTGAGGLFVVGAKNAQNSISAGLNWKF